MELAATAISVVEKTYTQADGTALVANLIRLGDQDYMTVAEAAEAFGVTEQNIRKLVSSHGLVATPGSDHNIAELRKLGVIPFKTTVVNLLPRDTIDELLRIINTDEAKAAYRQILGEWREAVQERSINQDIINALEGTTKVLRDHDRQILSLGQRQALTGRDLAKMVGLVGHMVDMEATINALREALPNLSDNRGRTAKKSAREWAELMIAKFESVGTLTFAEQRTAYSLARKVGAQVLIADSFDSNASS